MHFRFVMGCLSATVNPRLLLEFHKAVHGQTPGVCLRVPAAGARQRTRILTPEFWMPEPLDPDLKDFPLPPGLLGLEHGQMRFQGFVRSGENGGTIAGGDGLEERRHEAAIPAAMAAQ